MAKRPKDDPPARADGRLPLRFAAERLDHTIVAYPLIEWLREEPKTRKASERRELPGQWSTKERAWEYPVVVDVHLDHPPQAAEQEGGTVTESPREAAKRKVIELIEAVGGRVSKLKTELSGQYVIAHLTKGQIEELVRRDLASPARTISRISPDCKIHSHIDHPLRTINCDAAPISFSATGKGVVWAVMDSGIDRTHPQFRMHANLGATAVWKTASERADAARAAADALPADAPEERRKAAEEAAQKAEAEEQAASERAAKDTEPFDHQDFTERGEPLTDAFGHGTHVAGILAGEVPPDECGRFFQVTRQRSETGQVRYKRRAVGPMSGMAPCCRLVSLKVLDDDGSGLVSNLIAAIGYIQKVNDNGRRLHVHGVNMSVGYDFDPEWFACGQSPLCVEVDRLVRSGVVVVVAAGNSGYGFQQVKGESALRAAGLDLTINDPGNAELAITVGSTHRDSPHVYGVSYFSSKGPTGDGRLKPDLLAPGERIVSCAAGRKRRDAEAQLAAQAAFDAMTAPAAGAAAPAPAASDTSCHYLEDSGTSMSAPHVSGAIAAFLSVRQEFRGQPERVKEIFISTATDLGRERYFQGHGLVDMMRAIQSV
jgi:subtilisin family serine protease